MASGKIFRVPKSTVGIIQLKIPPSQSASETNFPTVQACPGKDHPTDTVFHAHMVSGFALFSLLIIHQ